MSVIRDVRSVTLLYKTAGISTTSRMRERVSLHLENGVNEAAFSWSVSNTALDTHGRAMGLSPHLLPRRVCFVCSCAKRSTGASDAVYPSNLSPRGEHSRFSAFVFFARPHVLSSRSFCCCFVFFLTPPMN